MLHRVVYVFKGRVNALFGEEHYTISIIYNASHSRYLVSLVCAGFWELHTHKCMNYQNSVVVTKAPRGAQRRQDV